MAELELHPTVKPVQMIADAIRDVSGRGEIVLDLFGGSRLDPDRRGEDRAARLPLRARSGLLRPDHPPLGGLRQGRGRAARLRLRRRRGRAEGRGMRRKSDGRSTALTVLPPPTSYEVGYRKPPVHSQFQKGQLGQPQGPAKGREGEDLPGARRAAEGDRARGGLPDDRRPRRPARGEGADGAGDRPGAGGERGQGPAAGAAALHRALDHHRAARSAASTASCSTAC